MTEINSTQALLKTFNKRLENLHKSLQVMKTAGIDEDILIAYLCHNLKISEKKAKQYLGCVDEFYNKFYKELLVKDLTDEKPKSL